jgi:asparagine synthase (glutamine-hydrolysing)
MSTVFGILDTNGEPVEQSDLERMRDALFHTHWQPDRVGLWRKKEIALGQLTRFSTPESVNGRLPLADARGNCVIVVDARIDNREALFGVLDTSAAERARMADSALLLRAYQKWGTELVQHIYGAFALVIWDSEKRRLFCARDHMGCKPFFYAYDGRRFVFATEVRGITAIPGMQVESNPQWIANYLCRIQTDKESTFHKQIQRLPPAHTLIVNRQGTKKRRYWDFDLGSEISLPTDAEYEEAAREKLLAAVTCRTRTLFPMGSELSGGIDSSSLASIAWYKLRQEGRTLATFSHASPLGKAGIDGFRPDERENIDKILAFAGIPTSHFFCNEGRGTFDLVQRAFLLQSGAAQCDFTRLTGGIVDLAAGQGVRTLLSGLGGDHLVTSRAGISGELLRLGRWDPLWRELRGCQSVRGKPVLRQLCSLILAEEAPGLKRILRKVFRRKDDAAERLEQRIQRIQKVLDASPEIRALVQGVDWEERLRADRAAFLDRAETMREYQYKRIMSHVMTGRIEASALSAASRGLEYRYPLLDVPLMTFYLALPIEQKRRDGYGRHLYRRSLSGLVPQEIQWAIKEPGHMYPWLVHSSEMDRGREFPDPPPDASEEVRVYYLIEKVRKDLYWSRVSDHA